MATGAGSGGREEGGSSREAICTWWGRGTPFLGGVTSLREALGLASVPLEVSSSAGPGLSVGFSATFQKSGPLEDLILNLRQSYTSFLRRGHQKGLKGAEDS